MKTVEDITGSAALWIACFRLAEHFWGELPLHICRSLRIFVRLHYANG